MNKRGSIEWESDKVGRIILAVIGIVALILLGTHIYDTLSTGGQLKQATSSLDYLQSQIDSGFNSSIIQNPEGWTLSSYPQKFGNKNLIPKQCEDAGWTDCICICKGDVKESGGIGFVLASSGNSCDSSSTGICKKSDFKVLGLLNTPTIYFAKGSLPMVLKINQDTKTISQK